MPDSEVIRVMKSFKSSLLREERAEMTRMAQAWLGVERRLSGDMAALAAEMHDIAEGGGTVSADLLFDHRRYRLLMRQLTDELGTYTRYADRTITDRQAQLARLGIDHAVSAIEAQGVRAGFARLPVEAVERMVGLAGNGSPLRTLLTATWPDAAEGLTQQLIRGVALGWNPRKTARAMAAGSTRSLDRMMNIARSEQMRVYRTASLDAYKATNFIKSYKRLSARDSRTCAGCLAADSTEYALEVEFKSHPSCRCTLVPIIDGLPPLRFQSGTEWFAEQDVKTQREILGPTKYGMWSRGMVDFSEFASVRHNATWGDAIVPTTVRELTGA